MLADKEYVLSMRKRERQTRDGAQRQYTILNKLLLESNAPTSSALESSATTASPLESNETASSP